MNMKTFIFTMIFQSLMCEKIRLSCLKDLWT